VVSNLGRFLKFLRAGTFVLLSFVLSGFCFMLFCIGSIVCIIVLLIVANHFWNLLCFLLCPCWKRTDVGSNFVVMSSKFFFFFVLILQRC
jgi:hypothetical protein